MQLLCKLSTNRFITCIPEFRTKRRGRFYKTSTTSKLHCIFHQGVNTRI